LADLDDVTDYSSITQMTKDFKPYYDLWTVVEQWRTCHHSWLHDAFEEVDATTVEDTVDNANKTMAQVMRFFRDKELPGILKIADGTKRAVEDFKPQVPILTALRTEGMQERHWETLSEKLGFELKPGDGFTFQKCLDMNLVDYVDDIVDVGDRAGKEYNIETSMAKMKAEWTNIELGLKPFKRTGTFSVFGFDDAM